MKRKYAGEHVKKYFPRLSHEGQAGIQRLPTDQQVPTDNRDNDTPSSHNSESIILTAPPESDRTPPGMLIRPVA
jgi:hypothetical protein